MFSLKNAREILFTFRLFFVLVFSTGRDKNTFKVSYFMNISSMNGMTQGSSKILQCQKYKRESLKCLNMKTGSEPVCKIKQKFHSSFFNSTFSVYKCINIRNTLYPCLFMDPFSRIIIAFSRGRAILKQNKYFGTSFRSLIRRGVKKTDILQSG